MCSWQVCGPGSRDKKFSVVRWRHKCVRTLCRNLPDLERAAAVCLFCGPQLDWAPKGFWQIAEMGFSAGEAAGMLEFVYRDQFLSRAMMQAMAVSWDLLGAPG